MRTIVILLAGALLATGTGCGGAFRRAQREQNPQWEVTGYGENSADAEQQALSKASQTVAEFLEKNHPALAWSPPGSYLKRRGIASSSGAPTTQDLELSGRMVAVRLHVEITPEFLEESLHLSRQARMEQRQHDLALALGGGLAGLLVIGGYLRLEEATRGYYTRVLRLTAAGLLGAVGAGLWFLR